MSRKNGGQKSQSGQSKVLMTQPAARRIQVAADKAGENSAFKARAMSVAQTHANGLAIPVRKS